MHDILVALAFVAMVACPAVVAAFPKRETDDEAEIGWFRSRRWTHSLIAAARIVPNSHSGTGVEQPSATK